MKKVFLLVLLFAFANNIEAQLSDNKWGLGVAVGSYGTTNAHGMGFMPELYFSRYISPGFDIMLKGDMGFFNSRLISKLDMAAPFLNLRFKLTNERNKLRPYLFAGPGFLADNKKSGLNFNIGFGSKYYLNSGAAIYLDGGYINGINISELGETVKDNFWKATVGIEFGLKKSKDSDGDGFSDKKDKCPDTPAGVPVDEKGCPIDTDGDGVVDYLDDCPTNAGLTSLKGCPDRDGDGISDKDDDCPEMAGLVPLKGCPDSDGDGIADKDDKCSGTPKGWKTDSFGCSLDHDNDGVADAEDNCPTVAGFKENKGCPTVESANVDMELDKDSQVIPIIKKVNNTVNTDNQDVKLSRATLGFSYYKTIKIEETRDFRVNLVINGTKSLIRSNIRNIEKKALVNANRTDTSIVCFIDDFEVYKSLNISLECDPGDFTITPIDTVVKNIQVIDFVKGNNWSWHVKAVSKINHVGNITLKIQGITAEMSKYNFTPQEIGVEIIISQPDPLWKKILNWVGGKIEYVLSAFFAAFVGYLVKRIFEKKKE